MRYQRMTKDRKNWLWLCGIPELNWRERMLLLSFFQEPGRIRFAPVSEFQAWERIGRTWVRKIYPWLHANDPEDDRLRSLLDRMRQSGISFVSRKDSDFPKKLKNLPECPHGLYYIGSLPEEQVYTAAVVGARCCSSYGSAVTRRIVSSLASCGIQVVSGMACGIDGIAQQTALDHGARSFAVLGCGADICYPRSNIGLYEELKRSGGIISELPPGTGPARYHFPFRNRLISGLCDSLIVAEAREKSGTLITAEYALDYGKDIFAVPGRNMDELSRGCNRLIADGAGIVLSPEELAETLLSRNQITHRTDEKFSNNKPEEKELVLAPKDELVYSNVSLSPSPLERITRDTGLDAASVSSIILDLQMRGLIREVAKNQYVRV